MVVHTRIGPGDAERRDLPAVALITHRRLDLGNGSYLQGLSVDRDPHFASDLQKRDGARYVVPRYSVDSISGIQIAGMPEAKKMVATQIETQMTPCAGPLSELEVPMINSIVTCLRSEHRKLTYLILQLTSAATRLASEHDGSASNQWTIEIWNEIRSDLWSHLQIEDGLVFSWGEPHHAISGALRDALKNERQKMRRLIAGLPALSSGVNHAPHTLGDDAFAQTLLALARTLESHVERYDGEVLPSIPRALR